MRYHQSDRGHHCERCSASSQVDDKYDYTGISFPASYEDISKFEDQNQVCIYVYAVENESIIPDKPGNAKYMMNDCIHLLRLEDGTKSHYAYIKHIDRLLDRGKNMCDKDKRYCPTCQGKVKFGEYNERVGECYACRKDSTVEATERRRHD